MPSKKKSIDEARTRLQEKVNDVKNKADNFHSLIDSISKEVSIPEFFEGFFIKSFQIV